MLTPVWQELEYRIDVCRVTRVMYQKGVFYSATKMYNHLPSSIKDLSHGTKRFKQVLKGFIQTNSFYSLEDYLNFNW
jgi:hypothetical protein